MPAPDSIKHLVERFAGNLQHYRSQDYNETEVRVHFVNPMFEALGWDVQNRERYEVVHEAQVTVDEGDRKGPKHPDYGFRIGKDTRFFVEAKKPSVNLKDNSDPAYQVRRYGWSAKLPVSVLTDFEEFIIYDCRVQPTKDDKAHIGRIRYYTYQDYIEKWDEIAALFSREAVVNNALDELVRGEKTRGTLTVDEAFLQAMEAWRVMLAKDMALHNPQLTRRQLNMAVQATIDRIVFLRIAEDRGIEPYGRLSDFARGTGIYNNLKTLFQQADHKYNSGLFHFQQEKGRAGDPDAISLTLTLSDDSLNSIIGQLYYPNSPYEFSVLPADILGQVYERFLGKVIELTETGGATVVEKPEVRKAGGVYYTPTYIVEYIVQNTVGKLVDGKTPDAVSHLRILDPACGSGSFLIGAFQYLMDWHLAYYTANKPEKWLKDKRIRPLKLIPSPFPAGEERESKSALQNLSSFTVYGGGLRRGSEDAGDEGEQSRRGSNAAYALTTDEKKRILLNNLYGVDLDQQAVEVTKLSLLLKVLEGETAESAQPQLLAERVLPDLSNNIKWGNSLIGPDFYHGKMVSMFGEEDLYKVKVFDWHSNTTGFGRILSAGGFDAVIGNPPYIRIQTMQETAPETIPHYKNVYKAAAKGNYDIYVVFVEKGLQLLKHQGRLGYILPHKFFNAQYGEPLRSVIAAGKHLGHVVHFGDLQVFSGATTYTCLMFLDKAPQEQFHFVKVEDLARWQIARQAIKGDISADKVTTGDWNFSVGENSSLLDKLNSIKTKLEDVTDRIFQGLVTSADPIYLLEPVDNQVDNSDYVRVLSNETGREYLLEKAVLWPLCKGARDIRRYTVSPSKWVLFPYDSITSAKMERTILISDKDFSSKYPRAWEYLLENSKRLREREKGKMQHDSWYGYVYPKSVSLFAKKKILTPSIASHASYVFDKEGELYFVGSGGGGGGGYGIILKNDCMLSYEYVLGLLNSKILDYYLKQISSQFSGGYYAYNRQYIEQLPIRTINFDDPTDKKRHDRMVELVTRMLDLHKHLPSAAGQAKEILQAQIEATDREIDALVYELYGLTDEEIAIVEGRA